MPLVKECEGCHRRYPRDKKSSCPFCGFPLRKVAVIDVTEVIRSTPNEE